ncbi:hypothetical protein ANO11243_023920 [Dothideomycetidae sp. 11243]|nr:hypothetical protein ANO11243_023920 [fungal sp. No.11243]
MGPVFSVTCPQFGNGLNTLYTGMAVTSITWSTYFMAASTDSGSLGFWATIDADISPGVPVLAYTNKGGATTNATCIVSNSAVNGPITTASIQCPVANTAFATGTVDMAFPNYPFVSYKFYVGETTVTTDEGVTTTTAYAPGQTVYITTDTSTTYEATITTTPTVTLTGSACSTHKPSKTCTNGAVYQTLANCRGVAEHLCSDLLTKPKHSSFPSTAALWPAATLSSACSCYEKTVESPNLARRGSDAVYDFFTAYNVSSTVGAYNSTVIATDVAPLTASATTTYVDGGNTTVNAGTTVTTCAVSDVARNKERRMSRDSTCGSDELLGAYLYIEMADPISFCKFYLSEPRSHSPLFGVSAGELKDGCASVLTHAKQSVPTKSNKHPVPASGHHACNGKFAAEIKAAFNQYKLFCIFWNDSKIRDLTPIPHASAADISAGCQCIS